MQRELSIATANKSESKRLPSGFMEGIAFPKANLTVASIVATDLIALLVAIGLTVAIRLMLAGQHNYYEYWRLWPMIGIFLFAFSLAGLYPGVPMNPINELRNVFIAVTVVFLIFSVFIFLSRSDTTYSRGIFLLACPISAVTVVFARSGLRHTMAGKSWWGIPVVIIGGGPAGQKIAETLLNNSWIGLKVVAVLDDNEIMRSEWQAKHKYFVGGLDLADPLTRDGRFPYSIVAMPHISREKLLVLLERYASRFRHILIVPDLFGLSSLWVTAQDIGGMLGLEIRQTLLQRWPKLIKRIIELVLTILGGLLLIPLMLLIWLAIRLTSSGPIVYGQMRIGYNGQHFTAWKFRTMVADADQILDQCLQNSPELMKEWKQNHKLRHDPRITVIGKLLRRTSLDELPQLWNVLRGEMSLVGPRPIVDDEVSKYGHGFSLYCKVRPGITGLWQVSGRNNTGYDKRVQLDEYYVRNWSIWLDIYLLGRTVGTIIRCTGAY